MKMEKLRSYLIVIKSVFLVFKVSLQINYVNFRGKLTREYVDKLSMHWCSKVLKYINLKINVANKQNIQFLKDRHYIIMCNHASVFDIPVSIVVIDDSLRMLAKKELFKVPVWGGAMKAAEFIAIDRGNKQEAIKSLALASEKMQSGIRLWVAPEGTRSKDGKLLKFKKGGFVLGLQTEAIIIPMVIKGIDKVLPKKSMSISLNETVDVVITEPVDCKNYGPDQRDELMNKVRKQMLEALDQNTGEESDC